MGGRFVARLHRVPARVVAERVPVRDDAGPARAAGPPSDLGGGDGNFTSVYLEPLPPSTMEPLLGGLVPGLPDVLRRQILERAEGIPLYAVETVRMLLDRGALVQEESVYRPARMMR